MRDPLGAIPVTATRFSRMGLLFGRFVGLLLSGAGAFAGFALYSEFKVWQDPLYKQISLVIFCGGALAFALIQGGRMFFAKTTNELGFSAGIRVFGIAIIIAFLLLALLFNLPSAAARGPLAAVAVVLQVAVLIAGLVPLVRNADRRQRDGA
jgi:hypothetical protein